MVRAAGFVELGLELTLVLMFKLDLDLVLTLADFCLVLLDFFVWVIFIS